MQGKGQYSFKSSKQEGAILVPGDDIDSEDALETSEFIRYIRKNSASWLKFASKNNRPIRLVDLVLVTGWHKTSSWACAAFSRCSSEINLEFNIGLAGTTSGGVWGTWSKTLSPGVWGHSGPPRSAVVLEPKDKEQQPSPPQSDESPLNVEGSSNINSCVYTGYQHTVMN